MLNQIQSSVQLPVVAGVEIPLDDQGRYNLNALHRAHEAQEGAPVPNKAPAQWTRTQQAQEFIKEISDMQICTSPIETFRGGLGVQGTFAHELIAVEYAGWISPKFRILVNQVFIDFRTGKLVPAQPTIKDPLLASINVMLIELDDAKQRLASLEERTEKVTTAFVSTTRAIDGKTKRLGDETKRIDDTVQRHEKILSHRDPAKKFNVTHIGRLLGLKAHEVNKLLEKARLQEKVESAEGKSLGWKLLPSGERYGRQNQSLFTMRGTPCNASVSWSEEVADVLFPLVQR